MILKKISPMYYFINVTPKVRLRIVQLTKKYEYMSENETYKQKTENFSPKYPSTFNNVLKIIRNAIFSINIFLLNSNSETKLSIFPRFPVIENSIIDTARLNLKQEEIIDQRFLFSPKTTETTEIEGEIEEIEDDEYRYSNWRNFQIGLALGGSATGMWFAYKGLTIWEKWMKDQEQRDIEEEIQMTGTYISPGAGNVETSIDPITGKKIQIKPLKQD
nr:hypothetical protein 1634Bnrm1_p090 [Cryptomonas sp.]